MSPLNVDLTRCGVEVEIKRGTVREIGVTSRRNLPGWAARNGGDWERAWYVNFTPKRRRMERKEGGEGGDRYIHTCIHLAFARGVVQMHAICAT
jgi:hypothetical protein